MTGEQCGILCKQGADDSFGAQISGEASSISNSKIVDFAQAIGCIASDFIREELKIDCVFDYMFLFLNEDAKNEDAKILKFKSQVPEGASEWWSEINSCSADHG